MNRSRRNIAREPLTRSIMLSLLVAMLLLGSVSCAAQGPWDSSLSQITRPYRFSFFRWHLIQFAGLLRPVRIPREAQQDPTGYVQAYFALETQARALQRAGQELRPEQRAELVRMRSVAERIIADQVAEAFRAEGIYNPLDRFVHLPVMFPPVWFVFAPPPHILIVSPRDEIVQIRQVMLVQEMDVATMEQIEAEVEALGLSALVTPIGGLAATYPAVVNTRTTLPRGIETVAEEWLHQYLAFTPTGFHFVLHLLHLRTNREIAAINESLAHIVHEEIGERILAEHYGILPAPEPEPPAPEIEPVFDFRAYMRETRLQTDALLAEGKIEAAEHYMAERRLMLQPEGYYIRKLNQAYFAFYGTYADAPGAITTVGEEFQALRAESPSLRAFLSAAVTITTREDLYRLLEEQGIRWSYLAPAH